MARKASSPLEQIERFFIEADKDAATVARDRIELILRIRGILAPAPKVGRPKGRKPKPSIAPPENEK